MNRLKLQNLIWLWALGAISLSLIFPFDIQGTETSESITMTEMDSRSWQLCIGGKAAEYKEAAAAAPQCHDAVIEKKTSSSIPIIFAYPAGIGLMEGTSNDGIIYAGGWRNCDQWGNWHLNFASPDSASGWTRKEGGEKSH